MIDAGQCNTVAEYVDIGRKKAQSWSSAASASLRGNGWLLPEPSIFAGVEQRMRIAQEEIFGPVLSVIRSRLRRKQ